MYAESTRIMNYQFPNMNYPSSPDKITRDYFDSLLLETRYMDSDVASTEVEILGHHFDTPIMTAALSHLGSKGKQSASFIEHQAESGMIVYAEAAARCNTLHWVGMGDDQELEDIVATGAKTVKVIKPHKDNAEVLRKINHAVTTGCVAVGMDIDHAYNGTGGYDSVFGLEMRPKSTEEIRDLVQAAGVPFVVKGVLSAWDAERCAKAGCRGIVVSHHHGMMQYAVAPLMVIDDILKAVGTDMEVFVDCGIVSGMDAYKCLALGAKAVSVGRHLMPLLKHGPEVVAARIQEMTAELRMVMNRTAVRSLQEMDPSVIHRRQF